MAKKPYPRKEIRLTLSYQELRRLVEMIYVAHWVLTAHHVEEDPRTVPYEELEQKVFALAHQHGLRSLVEYNTQFQQHFPTQNLEEGTARDFLNEYEEDFFWEELPHRLSQRDVVEQVGGEEAYLQLSAGERVKKIWENEHPYYEELEQHGLRRLRIVVGEEEEE